jgi:hypothetical protein
MLDVHQIKTLFVERFIPHRYDLWECEECTDAHSSSIFWARNEGRRCGWKFFPIKRSTVDKSGNMEVWRDFSLKFSSEIWIRIYTGTDNRDLANG